jgi:hypothetical protein
MVKAVSSSETCQYLPDYTALYPRRQLFFILVAVRTSNLSGSCFLDISLKKIPPAGFHDFPKAGAKPRTDHFPPQTGINHHPAAVHLNTLFKL